MIALAAPAPVIGPPRRFGGPSVLGLVAGASGCSLWRVFQPFAALEQRGYPCGWDFIGEDASEGRAALGLPPVPAPTHEAVVALCLRARFDAVMLPRLSWHPGATVAGAGDRRIGAVESGLALLAKLRAAGKVLIYEADDDLFSPWIVAQQARGLLRGTPEDELEAEREARIAVLRACDGATVSSHRLATIVRRYVPEDFPVRVVPNSIDWQWWQAMRRANPRTVPPLTVGWAGGGRPDDDLAPMAAAWGTLAQRYPDLRFVVIGCRPGADGVPGIASTPWLRPILDHVPAERLVPLPWLPPQAYPAAYFNVDIGCAPLANRPFNRCKTPIKVQEYAAAGAAVVASPTVYAEVVRHGENGYLAETAAEWTDYLARLVEDGANRRELGRNLRRDVATRWSLEARLGEWPTAWGAIVDAARERAARRVLVLAS